MRTIVVVAREDTPELEAHLPPDEYSLRAVTPDELPAAVEDGPPDVVIIAGALRARGGSSDLSDARELLPGTPIVALAPLADPRAVRWAVDKGADGVVWETRIEDALRPTVEAVCAGQLVVPGDARRQTHPPELTTREKQVLSLVVMGLSNGEIAGQLYLTESTVKSHLGTAFRKLGVRSRAEAARLVADPERGFGTGILAITGPALAGADRRDTR
jgi:DNA-binding NarL/FixJ family response regulator